MSVERVELVQRTYEAWAGGDFQPATDLFDDQLVFINTPDFVPRIAWGLAETERFLADFLSDWKEFRLEATRFLDAGDSVVAAVRQHGVGRESQAPVEVAYHQVWTFRGDRVIRIENFWQESEALRAVGLPAED